MQTTSTTKLRRALRDEHGEILVSNMAGIVVQMITLIGLVTGMVMAMTAFTSLAALNAITTQLTQTEMAMREDVKWATNIPVMPAADGTPGTGGTLFTAVIAGFGEQDGCKESTWSIEDVGGKGQNSLVNTVRLYSDYTIKEESEADPITASNEVGSSVCTGEVTTTETTVMIKQVGDDARFTFHNAGGQVLAIDGGVNEGPRDVKLATGELAGMELLSAQAKAAGQRIEGVSLEGKIAAGTDRETEMSLRQNADHLEVKPTVATSRNLSAEAMDPMILSR